MTVSQGNGPALGKGSGKGGEGAEELWLCTAHLAELPRRPPSSYQPFGPPDPSQATPRPSGLEQAPETQWKI